MARRGAARAALIVGLAGSTAGAVSYVTSSLEITDLKLIAIEASQLKDISELNGEALPETPVFRVRFSTRSDLVALANGLDAYVIRNRLLVGDGCNPALKTMSYARVAFMLLDFTRVFDATGNVEGRGWGATDESDEYVFHFGIAPSELTNFVSAGLEEAPLCFSLTGESRTRPRPLYQHRSIIEGGSRRSRDRFRRLESGADLRLHEEHRVLAESRLVRVADGGDLGQLGRRIAHDHHEIAAVLLNDRTHRVAPLTSGAQHCEAVGIARRHFFGEEPAPLLVADAAHRADVLAEEQLVLRHRTGARRTRHRRRAGARGQHRRRGKG